MVVVVSEIEWRTKKERKLLSEHKVHSFALIRRHHNTQIKEMSSDGKETHLVLFQL